MNLQIKQLAACPEHLETVGMWIYEQWWRKPGNTPQIVLEKLREHLTPDAIPFTMVALENGTPVGSCCVIENDCPLRPQYTPWVAAVFVKSEKRRQGIASRILQEIVRIAAKLDLKGLYIDCWAKTAPLYANNGWIILETDVGQKDSIVMYRKATVTPSLPPTSTAKEI